MTATLMLKTKSSYFLIALNLNLLPPEQLLADTGQTVQSIATQAEIDSTVAVQIVHNLERYCQIANWRTLFGRQIGMNSHGPVGFATLSAPTLGQALETFIRYEPIQSQMFQGQIIEAEQHYYLQLQDVIVDQVFSVFLFEVFAKAIESMVVQLFGGCAQLGMSIAFAQSLLPRRSLLQSEFDCQLQFDCGKSQIVFAKSSWHQPSPLSDKDVFELNLAKCRKLAATQQQGIEAQVNRYLFEYFEQVILGSIAPSAPPSLGDIAQSLHLTERTLMRKLKRDGQSYKGLLEANRKVFACQLLSQPRYNISQIAELLAYKDTANFCRSFKRWFGQTPSQYRKAPKD